MTVPVGADVGTTDAAVGWPVGCPEGSPVEDTKLICPKGTDRAVVPLQVFWP